MNDKDKDFKHLLLRYLPYWPYFLGSILVCTFVGMLYLRYATPVYQISASILIKDTKKDDNNNTTSQFLSSLDVFSSKKIVENETEILTSHHLMSEVVKRLGLYAPISRKGRIHNTSAYTLSPINVRLKFPDSIETLAKNIYFTYDSQSKSVKIDQNSYPINLWVRSPWGIIKFIPNPNYSRNPIREHPQLFFSLLTVNVITDNLLSNIDVEPSSKLSTVIIINFKDKNAKRGVDILNELFSNYKIESLKDKNKLAANSINFLDDRLNVVSSGLDSIENTLQLFKSNRGVVDLDEQGKLILGNVVTNDQKVTEIDGQLAVLTAIKSNVENNTGSPSLIPSPDDMNDVVLSNYLTSLYDSEIQYYKLSKTTAQNNPILLSLENQISKIKPTLLQYVDSKISTLDASRNNLKSSNGKYASAIRTLPQKERQLLEISRQQTIKNNLYTFLLQKREEAALSYAASVSDVRVIDNAHSGPSPESPKKSLVLGLAFILGLCFPVVLLNANSKIVSNSEISEILNFPIIGQISKAHLHDDFICQEENNGLIMEQFRQIRTGLLSFEDDINPKRILVTSAISDEGKSFVASNLAYNLAISGKKTLLMELDLRKPSISQLFNVTNERGISEFLNDKASQHEIIHPTHIDDNLYIIPAGQLPPNPSELLLNGRLKKLLSHLEDSFDIVVLETPPVNLFTDGYIVSKCCDVTLFVVRYMTTPKTELVEINNNLNFKLIKKSAIVFNGIRNRRSVYESKYKGYIKYRQRGQVRI